MRSSRDASSLGDKLGPKLIAAVSQSVIATKKGLGPTEHKIRVGAMQTIVDRAGHEMGDHYGGLIRRALAHEQNTGLDDGIRKFLEDTASGRDQWKAISGVIGISQSLLGQVISAFIAPVVYEAMEHINNLLPDLNTVVGSVVQGLTQSGQGATFVRQLGIQSDWYDTLLSMAQQMPDMQSLNTWALRGWIDDSDYDYWLMRNAIPQQLWPYYRDARQNILTVADAALGVLRTDLTLAEGQAIAAENGYTNDDFNTFILNTGEPPGTQDLSEMLRRGFITQDLFKLGIAQSRVRDQWVPYLLKNIYQPPSTADAIEASIQGYMTKDQAKAYALENGLEEDAFDPLWSTAGEPLSRTEMTDLWNWGFTDETAFKAALQQSRLKDSYIDLATHLRLRPMSAPDAIEAYVQGYLSDADAQKLWGMNGLRPEDYEAVRNTAGNPLSLTEMLRLWNRGLVNEDGVKAALRESRLKDSYIDLALNLRTAFPSVYDIRTFLADGVLSVQLATELLQDQGYSAEVIKALVTNYTTGGSTTTKTVTEGMLVDLYLEHAISEEDLIESLTTVGYSKPNAELIAEYATLKLEMQQRNALISKTRTLYVGRKISETTAQNDLTVALVPSSQIDYLMELWGLEIAGNIKTLSEAQIIDAWALNLYSQDDAEINTTGAINALENLGYSSGDAMMLIQIKNGGPLGATSGGKSSSGTTNSASAQSS